MTVVKLAQWGSDGTSRFDGYELTLRLEEADQIEIDPIEKRSNEHRRTVKKLGSKHPGIGETGKFHSKKDENPLPEGTKLTYALVGNQNCGKTTCLIS